MQGEGEREVGGGREVLVVIPVVSFRKAARQAGEHDAYLRSFGVDFDVERDGFAVAVPLAVTADVVAAAYLHELSPGGDALAEERGERAVLGYLYVF